MFTGVVPWEKTHCDGCKEFKKYSEGEMFYHNGTPVLWLCDDCIRKEWPKK